MATVGFTQVQLHIIYLHQKTSDVYCFIKTDDYLMLSLAKGFWQFMVRFVLTG